MWDLIMSVLIIAYLFTLIRFWGPCPNFQDHHVTYLVKMSLVCTHKYLQNQLVDSDQTCVATSLKEGYEIIVFW